MENFLCESRDSSDQENEQILKIPTRLQWNIRNLRVLNNIDMTERSSGNLC